MTLWPINDATSISRTASAISDDLSTARCNKYSSRGRRSRRRRRFYRSFVIPTRIMAKPILIHYSIGFDRNFCYTLQYFAINIISHYRADPEKSISIDTLIQLNFPFSLNYGITTFSTDTENLTKCKPKQNIS